MAKLKVGIIGAGYIAGVHASILSSDPRTQLAMVHDAVTENALALASRYNAKVAHSPAEVIDSIDVLYITTPNTQHVSLAVASLKAGKHVFCEKPMATNRADALSVVECAEGSRGIFQVGHNRRFAPVYATLKQMLAETHVPHSAHVKMNRGELLKPVWTGDASVTGGFLYETPIHMFDMMRFLFGDVATLHAAGSKHEYAETDDFSILLKFVNGFHATVATASDASWLFPFERVEVFCHHATLVTREMESITVSDDLAGHFSERSMQQLPRDEKWGYVQENKAFIDSILNNTKPAVTALDGLRSVELVEAVYESVRSGTPVSLS